MFRRIQGIPSRPKSRLTHSLLEGRTRYPSSWLCIQRNGMQSRKRSATTNRVIIPPNTSQTDGRLTPSSSNGRSRGSLGVAIIADGVVVGSLLRVTGVGGMLR